MKQISADMIEQGITFAACVGGSFFCRHLLAKNPEDPSVRRYAKIALICAPIAALISLFFIAAELLGIK